MSKKAGPFLYNEYMKIGKDFLDIPHVDNKKGIIKKAYSGHSACTIAKKLS